MACSQVIIGRGLVYQECHFDLFVLSVTPGHPVTGLIEFLCLLPLKCAYFQDLTGLCDMDGPFQISHNRLLRPGARSHSAEIAAESAHCALLEYRDICRALEHL